jgi:hypothetical protein
MGDSMSPNELTPNSMLLLSRLQRWRMAFFGLVILLAGAAIGAGAALIWLGQRTQGRAQWGPFQGRVAEARLDPTARVLPNLRQYLGLTDQQMQVIAPIVKEHMANLQRLRQEVRPKVAEELREMDRQIASELNPDQRRVWERRFRRLQEQLQWQGPPYRGRGAPPERRQGPGEPAAPGQQEQRLVPQSGSGS